MENLNLNVTEKQARLIMHALEVFSRIAVGQLRYASEDFVWSQHKLDKKKYEQIKKIIERAEHEINLTVHGYINAHYGIMQDEVPDKARAAFAMRHMLGRKLSPELPVYDKGPFKTESIVEGKCGGKEYEHQILEE